MSAPPAQRSAPQASAASTSPVPPLCGILVVEDDNLVRIMLRSGLERHGFRVWLAADGAGAINLYRAHASSIAVVLLDVCMPGLDGPRTLDSLRVLNPEVVACFMTGDPGAYRADELLRQGARHVFTKPLLLSDLAEKLRACATERDGPPALSERALRGVAVAGTGA